MTDLGVADLSLAERIRAGDVAAEQELFVKFRRGVRSIIVHVTGSFAAAEDLSQEAFIVVLRRLRAAPLEDASKLAAFVAQTARNLAIAHVRKEHRRRTDAGGDEMEGIADEGMSPEARTHSEASAFAVRQWLLELGSERDRELLTRHYLKDEDKDVICRELGIRPTAFNVALCRARQRFRVVLESRGIARDDLLEPVATQVQGSP